jgi:chromosomal replication initiator protein
MSNTTDAWGKTLKHFQENYPDDYELWIMNLNFLNYSIKKGTLKLAVSNPIIRDSILSRFKNKIEEIFSSFINKDKVELEIHISEEKSIFEESTLEKTGEKKSLKPQKKSYGEKLVSDKNYTIDINRKFTFNRFVIGSNNQLAHAAAMIVAQFPGKEYNPFFIYGDVGLGKTHLMQAIGNYVLEHKPELNVVYVTVENYLNDYVMAIKNKKLENFRAKYRETDLLLLDDIQFLEKKEQTQEELFHTFNKLHQNNKQIVFTCDKPPKELKKIEERLITRFSWGLVADIKQPDMETRKAIIIKKLEEANLFSYVNSEMIDFLSENITTNIRDIESALLKIKSLVILMDQSLDIPTLENNLSDILTPIRAKQKKLTCEMIQREVANHYHISYSDMKSNKRTKDVSFPRQMAMYLSKNLLKLSFSEIGNEFGGRDHSTVVASCKKVGNEIKKNPSIRNDYEELLKIFSSF